MIKKGTQNFIDKIPGKPSRQEILIRVINKLLNFAITWDMNHLQKNFI